MGPYQNKQSRTRTIKTNKVEQEQYITDIDLQTTHTIYNTTQISITRGIMLNKHFT